MLLQDVLINMLQSSVSCRAVKLEEEHGCVSVLMHLSRAHVHCQALSKPAAVDSVAPASQASQHE